MCTFLIKRRTWDWHWHSPHKSTTHLNPLLFIEFNISIELRYKIMLTSILYKNKLQSSDSSPLQVIQYPTPYTITLYQLSKSQKVFSILKGLTLNLIKIFRESKHFDSVKYTYFSLKNMDFLLNFKFVSCCWLPAEWLGLGDHPVSCIPKYC